MRRIKLDGTFTYKLGLICVCPHINVRFVICTSLRLSLFFPFKYNIPRLLRPHAVYYFKRWSCPQDVPALPHKSFRPHRIIGFNGKEMHYILSSCLHISIVRFTLVFTIYCDYKPTRLPLLKSYLRWCYDISKTLNLFSLNVMIQCVF